MYKVHRLYIQVLQQYGIKLNKTISAAIVLRALIFVTLKATKIVIQYHTYICVEKRVILGLLSLVKRPLTPASHDGHNVIHVGLGLSHSLLQVTHTITSGLNVLPHTCTPTSHITHSNILLLYTHTTESKHLTNQGQKHLESER